MKWPFFVFIMLFMSCQSEKKSDLNIENINILNDLDDLDGDGVENEFDLDSNTREGVPVDDNGVMLNPIYLDENNITIKAFDWAISGDIGILNEVSYLIVDESTLIDMVSEDSDVTNICTSKITLFSQLFFDKTEFNQDISSWDTSNATATNFMFNEASSFNQDISFWNTTKVTDMNYMFKNASSFDQNIRDWDTSNVILMREMFYGAQVFNQDLSSWNVIKVNDCQSVFIDTSSWTLPKPSFLNCNP